MSKRENPDFSDLDSNYEMNLLELGKYNDLLSRAEQGVDTLSSNEREHLTQFGYYYLGAGNNAYEARRTFNRG
jgi:hypothetical protein